MDDEENIFTVIMVGGPRRRKWKLVNSDNVLTLMDDKENIFTVGGYS